MWVYTGVGYECYSSKGTRVIETIRCYEGRNRQRGEVQQLFTKIYRCKRCTNVWGTKPNDHDCKTFLYTKPQITEKLPDSAVPDLLLF